MFSINFSFATSIDESVLIKSNNINELINKTGINNNVINIIAEINVAAVKDLDFWQKTKLKYYKNFTNRIDYTVPNHIYKPMMSVNDTQFSNQWALQKIQAPSAWDISTGNSNQKIAVIDTGVNGLHQDLLGKVDAGYAFLDGGSTQYPILANTDSDELDHGTGIAGVIAAVTNNAKGIAGINWQAQIVPIKIFSSSSQAYSNDLARAIIWAANNNIKIINMSIGGDNNDPVINDAVNYAYNLNCVIIGSSGNNNSRVEYPAKYSKVIAVGTTNNNDVRSDYSNYGEELDLVAPGDNILLLKDSALNNEYEYASGTSVSGAFVSGLASLLLAQHPNYSNLEIESLIKLYADKVPSMNGQNFTNYYGYGRINAYKSLTPITSINPADYHYQWLGQSSFPTISAGQAYNFTLNVKNTGSATWYKNSVNLGTSKDLDRISPFLREDSQNPTNHPSNWITPNRIQMQQELVVPGETATFSFWISAPVDIKPGIYKEYFRLVADGITWMEDYGIYWDVIVVKITDSYHYSITSQNNFPTLLAGQGYNFSLDVKNTGNSTWDKSTVHLGTSNNLDRIPIFLREDSTNPFAHPSNWVTPNRIQMQQELVAPGETATFSFWMSAPTDIKSGSYKEYFRPVADGITWMEDYGIYWEITIN